MIIHANSNVLLFQFQKIFDEIEISFQGRLIGHLGVILAGCIIKDSLLATIDETAQTKFWSIEKWVCLMSVKMQSKSMVRHMFFIPSVNWLAFVSRKINSFKIQRQNKKDDLRGENKILNYTVDPIEYRLIIFRQKDMIFL